MKKFFPRFFTGSTLRFCGVLVGFLGILLPTCWATNLELGDVPSSPYVPPASGDNDSCFPVISRDARYVLFGSTADNLAVRSGNLAYQPGHPIYRNVFLYDRVLGMTAMISVDVTGTTGGTDHSMPTGISTNDQYVLFESQATNLVFGDVNTAGDVFRRDLAGQITTTVSASTNGGCGNGASTDSTMTPDGRYVAFSSLASNLVPGDTNGIADVFVRDTQSGTTALVSVGAQAATLNSAYRYNGSYSGASSSDLPEITPDGRYVAFLSTATNLVPGGTNPGEMYVRDMVSNLTYCVSTNADHYFTNIACFSQRISTNGQFVACEAFSVTSSKAGIIFRHNLQSGVDDLVTTNAAVPADYYKNIQSLDMTPDGRFIVFVGNTNSSSTSSIIVWDAQTATTNVVSLGTSGAVCDSPQIDPSGRYVSFRSTASNVVTNAVTAGSQHLYLCDLQAGTTQLVDVNTNGAGSAGSFVSGQSMDSSGRYVAFDSTGSDMTTNDNNGVANVFVRDTAAGATQLISAHHPLLASQTSVPTGISYHYNISDDGRYLAFAANGMGMAPGYTNRYRGIFVRDLIAQTNVLVSVSTDGGGDANGWSTDPMISGNGRYAAFTSWATNLVPNDANTRSDVFVRDLQTRTTSLISGGVTNPFSYYPYYKPAFSVNAISSDGRYVLFTDDEYSCYERDMTEGVTYNLAAEALPVMTRDGHYIALFGSLQFQAGFLSESGLFVWDSQADQFVYTNFSYSEASIFNLVISTNGQQLAFFTYNGTNGIHLLDWPTNNDHVIGFWSGNTRQAQMSFSGDGRYVTYSTSLSNAPGATNSFENVYLYDSLAGTNQLVSTRYYSPNGADGNSAYAGISSDGRYVVYESMARDIVPSDNIGFKQIYLFDRVAGSSSLLSFSSLDGTPGNFVSEAPEFTGAGDTIMFHSFAADLATNDFNVGGDLFILQLSTTNAMAGCTNAPSAPVAQAIYAPGSSGPAGANPALTWTAVPGASYQVMYKDNLTDPTWQSLNGSITISGNQGQAVDFTPNPVHRFYVIVAN